MKRSLLVAAAAALCVLPAVARPQGIGLLGGLSYGSTPNANGALPGTLHANSGFALGIGAETGGVVGFGINALYAQRGFKSSFSGYSQQLSFVDVPLYLRLAVPNPVLTPFAFVGPQVSFELDCGGGNCPSGRASTTYAGIIGAGVKFPALDDLSLQGRYIYGLTNLDYNTVSNSSNYKTRSFMLLLGIGF
jgi:hypothetical protein